MFAIAGKTLGFNPHPENNNFSRDLGEGGPLLCFPLQFLVGNEDYSEEKLIAMQRWNLLSPRLMLDGCVVMRAACWACITLWRCLCTSCPKGDVLSNLITKVLFSASHRTLREH